MLAHLTRNALLTPVILSVWLAACSRDNPGFADAPPQNIDPEAPYIQDEVLARFSAALTADEVAARVETWGGVILEDLGAKATGNAGLVHVAGTFRLGLPEGVSVEDALALLSQEGDLEYAEPDYVVYALKTPNDPSYGSLWGMPKIGAPTAWDLTTGSPNVVVGVIDTGVQYTHPDLAANMWKNPGEIPGNGIDDEGNGYIDDIYGYDFCNYDSDPMDDHYHGTHCAGTISGVGNNGVGVAGVSWNARIMALKFLCANGSGSTSGGAQAVIYAANNGATFTSNSWGGGGYSTTLYNAIQYAQQKNQLFIAAAGNNGANVDTGSFYPAGYDLPNIISVAASDSADGRASFSNYGLTRVDLAAPGVGIYSTMTTNSYGSLSGTSMATPHVAGAVALLYAHMPSIGWTDARDALFAGVDKSATWSTLVATGGRMNIARSLSLLAPAPPLPTGLTAFADAEGHLHAAWAISPDATVSRYRVYVRTEGGAVWPTLDVMGRETLKADLGPAPTGRHFVALTAVGAGGESAKTNEVLVVIRDVQAPARVLDLTAVPAPGERHATTASATSAYGESFAPGNLTDDNPRTAWAAWPEVAPPAERVTLDLGATKAVGRVTLRAADGLAHLAPLGLEIRLSDEAGVYTTVARELDLDWEASPERAFDVGLTRARFVEVLITEPASHASGLRYSVLGDVMVYGPSLDPGAVLLGFTAPGDDLGSGTATAYDLRAAPGLTQEGFDAAPRLETVTPRAAGTRQYALQTGLPADTSIGLAIAALDEAGNRAEPSNVATVHTGAIPPGAIDDLVVAPLGPGRLRLTFTAPAENGHDPASGAVAAYEIRWLDRPFTAATWPLAFVAAGPVPVAPGEVQTFELGDLPEASRYFVRVAALDAGGIRGPFSSEASADAPLGPDAVAPAAIEDLHAAFTAEADEPSPLTGELSLLDGDPATGWMESVAPGEPRTLTFALNGPVALSRVRLLPHLLYPGDRPDQVSVQIPDPLTGQAREVARLSGLPVAPGRFVELSFAPIETATFSLVLSEPVERFGVAAYALSEVEAFAALASGGVVRLTWIAPGDDAFAGQASGYELKRAPSPIESVEAFEAAEWGGVLAAPQPGGALEAASVPAGPEGETYYYSLRAVDEQGQAGPPSNPARIDIPAIPPAAVRDLRVVSVARDRVVVAFTAPGDDGLMGQAAAYDLRFLAGTLDATTFVQATPAPTPAPQASGGAERVEVTGLMPGVAYQLALVSKDESGAASGLSNVVSATTIEATPPATVQDLRVERAASPTNAAVVRFTAPGDDGVTGTASRYELRYALAPLTAANFAQGTLIPTAAPQAAGSAEVVTAANLPAEAAVHFALKAKDDVDNESALSNGAVLVTGGQAPGTVQDLRIAARTGDSLTLAFTAPGDDGAVGTAARYDLRISLSPIVTDANFAAATRLTMTAPKPGGSAETKMVTGLLSGSTYYFAIQAEDEVGQLGNRSPSVAGVTLDVTAPGRVSDLSALAGATAGSALLRFTAPGDDGSTGAATRYELRAAAAPLTDATFAQGTLIPTGTPKAAGSAEAYTATDLIAEATVHFAVVAVDEDGNRSALSNGASVKTPGVAPAPVADLRVSAREATTLTLTFTATGDDGSFGTATRYDLRRALAPITTDAEFAAATAIPTAAPQAAGRAETVTATGLASGTRYYFALVVEDDSGLKSPRTASVEGITVDTTAPVAVANLTATALATGTIAAVSEVDASGAYVAETDAESLTDGDLASAWVSPARDAPTEEWITLTLPAPTWVGGLTLTPAAGYAHLFPSAFTLSATSPEGEAVPVLSAVDLSVAEGEALSRDFAPVLATALRLTIPEGQPEAGAYLVVLAELALTAADSGSREIALSWAAPADVGPQGKAARYDLRRFSAPPTAATFSAGTALTAPAPASAGLPQSATASALSADTTYYFAVVSEDQDGNRSGLSNVASARTLGLLPGTVLDLRAEAVTQTSLTLRFTAPGADGNVGRATRYDLRRSTTTLSEETFAQATALAAPAPAQAGTSEQVQVTGLSPSTTYRFGLKAEDEVGLKSALSNVLIIRTADPPEQVPPGAVADLQAETVATEDGAVQVRFTAPGDDGALGQATRYELRWSTALITAQNFAQATLFATAAPKLAGSSETFKLTGLPGERTVYFALKAFDEVGNASALSNVASAATRAMPPAALSDARLGIENGRLVLRFTAVGADGLTGQAAAYWVYVSNQSFSDVGALPPIAGMPAPKAAGSAEALTLPELASDVAWYVAARAVDEKGNAGPLSAVLTATLPDTQAPGAVTELALDNGTTRGTVVLRFVSPGDDGAIGKAASYEVRYATAPLTAETFAQATLYQPALVVADGGARVTTTLRALPDEAVIYVALRAVDNAGLTGPISAVVSARTPDVAPGRVADLAAVGQAADRARLTWTAPGDDDRVGTATRYEARWALAAVTTANWDAATVIANLPAPAAVGTAQSAEVTGLPAGAKVYFALRAVDDRGNVGPLSNSPAADTQDLVPPGAVRDLSAEPGAGLGALVLKFIPAGDDGDTGKAAFVEVRAAPLPWPGFEAAPQVAKVAAGNAGALQTVTVSGLHPETEYAVAVRLLDDAGNLGPATAPVSAWTPVVAPGAIRDLKAVAAGRGALTLSFTAPADDGDDAQSGAVVAYQIAVSPTTFRATDFDAVPHVPGPAPVAPGGAQTHVLSGLPDDAEVFLAIRAIDDRGALGSVVAVVSARTPDLTAPSGVASLKAEGPRVGGDPLDVATVAGVGTLSEAWSPFLAFDGDLDTGFAATGEPGQVSLEARLQSAARIGGIRLHVGEWVDGFPLALTVLADGEPVAHVGDTAPEAHSWVELSFEPVLAQELRLVADALGEGGYVVLNEVEILPADDQPDELVLTWLTPGDDGLRGQAAAYDLRRSLAPITAANFAQATPVDAPAPGEAGTLQVHRVSGLAEETRYYFALTTRDEAGNVSPLSNVASATTGGIPPAPIEDLSAVVRGANAVDLSWTATGADADSGQAAAYELRYRPLDLSDATWSEGTLVPTAAPAPAGAAESMTVSGLLPGTRYAFALKVTDGRGHRSVLSNVAFAVTEPGVDRTAPAAIDELNALLARGDGRPLPIEHVSAEGSQFGYPPEAVADQDVTTAWASPARTQAGEESLILTLPAETLLSELRLRPQDDLVDLAPTDFVIEGSLDGTTFTPWLEVTGHVPQAGRTARFSFPPAAARQVRVRAQRMKRDASYLVVLAEATLYEAALRGTVTLTFRAPGDDLRVGRATRYLVAYAAAPITAANWSQATITALDQRPALANAPDALTLDGLAAGRAHFSVRAEDEAGNLAPVGASVQVDLP